MADLVCELRHVHRHCTGKGGSIRGEAVEMNGTLSNLWAWICLDNREIAGLTNRVSQVEKGVKKMADILDAVKADFEAYKGLVDSTISALQAKVAGLLAGQLDPAKAQAIDDEINAAKNTLVPPAP